MLKSLLMATMLALSLQTNVMASHEPAQPPVQPPVQPQVPAVPIHHVKLYYRECVHEPWKFYGCYDCIHDARDDLIELVASHARDSGLHSFAADAYTKLASRHPENALYVQRVKEESEAVRLLR